MKLGFAGHVGTPSPSTHPFEELRQHHPNRLWRYGNTVRAEMLANLRDGVGVGCDLIAGPSATPASGDVLLDVIEEDDSLWGCAGRPLDVLVDVVVRLAHPHEMT